MSAALKPFAILSTATFVSVSIFIGVLSPTMLRADDSPTRVDEPKSPKPDDKSEEKMPTTAPTVPSAPDSITQGNVSVGGSAIQYRAVAGTLTVGSSGAQDAALGLDGKPMLESGEKPPEKPEEVVASARMFYVAYFKNGGPTKDRPITFFYNGGPGSSSLWLHMGAFGPKRVITTDTEHDVGAPYSVVNNDYSLLDTTDLVFIDAPATGFSRIFGKDKEKAFFGMDQDADAFERFIRRFLTKYDRWNSPKFIFGESYGTTRSAILAARLQNLDINGIVLLSAILSFDNSADGPRWNPGVDQPYALALPTFAATAFYHHKLPNPPPALEPFLKEVEAYALGDYMSALLQGSELPDDRKKAVAEKLHEYTGLSVPFLMKSNLRVSGGAFSKNLEIDEETTVGRLDTRYKGPDLNPMSEEAEYDPQSNAIVSAYTSAVNQYLRDDLKYGTNQTYLPEAEAQWDCRHQAPYGPPAVGQSNGANVMPDLAFAMKSNPKMKVLLTGGYFDLATPFFEGMYEMHHLPIPRNLQSNIIYHYYQSGHMVYVNEGALKSFHDDISAFMKLSPTTQPASQAAK